MNVQKMKTALLSLVGTLILCVLIYQVTLAGCCANDAYAGGVARSYNTNYTVGSNQWRAEIISWLDNKSINKLGWTYWRVYEQCGGMVVEETTLSPAAAYNTNYRSNSYTQSFYPCSGAKITGNKGTHEYQDGSLTTIYRFLDNTAFLP